jgi:hypothetical protein
MGGGAGSDRLCSIRCRVFAKAASARAAGTIGIAEITLLKGASGTPARSKQQQRLTFREAP